MHYRCVDERNNTRLVYFSHVDERENTGFVYYRLACVKENTGLVYLGMRGRTHGSCTTSCTTHLGMREREHRYRVLRSCG